MLANLIILSAIVSPLLLILAVIAWWSERGLRELAEKDPLDFSMLMLRKRRKRYFR